VEQQRIFESTGGLHAAGLFDERAELELLREDIGRHNAVDKVVGRALLDGRLPLARSVTRRERGRRIRVFVQKAVAAGIPILAGRRRPLEPRRRGPRSASE